MIDVRYWVVTQPQSVQIVCRMLASYYAAIDENFEPTINVWLRHYRTGVEYWLTLYNKSSRVVRALGLPALDPDLTARELLRELSTREPYAQMLEYERQANGFIL